MRMIVCEIHGEVAAVLKDFMLLRYECSHCAMEREAEAKKLAAE